MISFLLAGPISSEDTSLVGGLGKTTPSGGHSEGVRGSLEGLSAEMSHLSIANTTSAVLAATANTGAWKARASLRHTRSCAVFFCVPI